ncbi:hypothetical protein HDU93_004608, partial [Gonapodya sp. JEL0774]
MNTFKTSQSVVNTLKAKAPKVVFLMADHGHDPTETSIPWKAFHSANLDISFATETGKQPECDQRMLSGPLAALFGAAEPAKTAYASLCEFPAFQKPRSWSDPSFNLEEFDMVFLPGGHEKSIRQILDSDRVHKLLAAYFPLTKKPSSKSLVAICHGVQLLAASTYENGKSVLADVTTTSLQDFQEQSIYQVTRLFVGDYYRTHGADAPTVEKFVTDRLDSPTQFQKSLSFAP